MRELAVIILSVCAGLSVCGALGYFAGFGRGYRKGFSDGVTAERFDALPDHIVVEHGMEDRVGAARMVA